MIEFCAETLAERSSAHALSYEERRAMLSNSGDLVCKSYVSGHVHKSTARALRERFPHANFLSLQLVMNDDLMVSVENLLQAGDTSVAVLHRHASLAGVVCTTCCPVSSAGSLGGGSQPLHDVHDLAKHKAVDAVCVVPLFWHHSWRAMLDATAAHALLDASDWYCKEAAFPCLGTLSLGFSRGAAAGGGFDALEQLATLLQLACAVAPLVLYDAQERLEEIAQLIGVVGCEHGYEYVPGEGFVAMSEEDYSAGLGGDIAEVVEWEGEEEPEEGASGSSCRADASPRERHDDDDSHDSSAPVLTDSAGDDGDSDDSHASLACLRSAAQGRAAAAAAASSSATATHCASAGAPHGGSASAGAGSEAAKEVDGKAEGSAGADGSAEAVESAATQSSSAGSAGEDGEEKAAREEEAAACSRRSASPVVRRYLPGQLEQWCWTLVLLMDALLVLPRLWRIYDMATKRSMNLPDALLTLPIALLLLATPRSWLRMRNKAYAVVVVIKLLEAMHYIRAKAVTGEGVGSLLLLASAQVCVPTLAVLMLVSVKVHTISRIQHQRLAAA